jgi:hypothetical protein
MPISLQKSTLEIPLSASILSTICVSSFPPIIKKTSPKIKKLIFGLDKLNLLCYIKRVIQKQSKASPHLSGLHSDSVVLADTEYHSCNRIVNIFFKCGLKNSPKLKEE